MDRHTEAESRPEITGIGLSDQYSLRPAVEVFENTDGITLRADLPGVDTAGLGVHVDGETLTIEGNIVVDLPRELKPLHAEVRAASYRRSFALSRELDVDNIRASLRDGVLEVRIPRRGEVRPRRIEVSG